MWCDAPSLFLSKNRYKYRIEFTLGEHRAATLIQVWMFCLSRTIDLLYRSGKDMPRHASPFPMASKIGLVPWTGPFFADTAATNWRVCGKWIVFDEWRNQWVTDGKDGETDQSRLWFCYVMTGYIVDHGNKCEPSRLLICVGCCFPQWDWLFHVCLV